MLYIYTRQYKNIQLDLITVELLLRWSVESKDTDFDWSMGYEFLSQNFKIYFFRNSFFNKYLKEYMIDTITNMIWKSQAVRNLVEIVRSMIFRRFIFDICSFSTFRIFCKNIYAV